MILKLHKRWMVLGGVLIGLLLPMTSALADCQVQSSSGDDDIVLCANPADTNGMVTSAGNDTVTINADTTVSATTSRTIDTGLGNDVVTNRGVVGGKTSTLFLDQGNDTFYNYGTVTSGDHAARCFPQAGQTCTFHNYATIHTDGEALDIISSGGHTVINNTGTITSDTQEPIHVHGGTSVITNTGTLAGQRQAIEVYDGSTVIVNEGTATAIDFAAIDTDHPNDDVTNRGYVRSEKMQAIMTAGGNDTIRHYGTAIANNEEASGAVIDGGRGNDTIIVGGDVTEIGNGSAAIRGESGNDTVIIEGGVFNRVIDGDEYGSNGYTDVLIFRFTGTQAEIDAFSAAMVGNSPANGTVQWRGNLYQWDGFEQIRQELTVGGGATATPLPPTGTPAPTSTPLPTNTAQPTGTSVPPTATSGGCPPSVPAGVTAQRHDPTNGSRNLRLQFEDVGTNACMSVTHFVIYAWSGSYSQQWMFDRSAITCVGGSCWANITLPSNLNTAYWRVEAYNALGTGGSDNSKKWTY